MITKEHARRLRVLMEQTATELTDTEALEGIELFPKWKADETYLIGERVRYNDLLYKCLLNHTSQESWTPDVSPSLWVRVDDPHVEFPDWVQPVGSADAYPLGAKVTHLEKHWVSTVENNVWEPSVYGWEEV